MLFSSSELTLLQTLFTFYTQTYVYNFNGIKEDIIRGWVLHEQTITKHCEASQASLTVSSRASLNRPLRLLWRKALELPALDIRILAKRAFCKEQESTGTTC